MNIHEFKKNDIITRVEPTESVRYDCSYMSERLVFIGAKNGSIVIKHHSFGAIVLPELQWGEGWNYYPEDLVNLVEKK